MNPKSDNSTTTLSAEEAVHKFKNVDEYRTFVETFNGQVLAQNKDFTKAVNDLRVKKQTETYITLGQAYGMVPALLAPENREYYVALLTERNIAVAKDGQNKYLPFCKLMFGHYDKNKNFVIDPTASTYAPVFRYFEDHGIAAQDVAQHIDAYSSDKFGTKLAGIRKQDQHDYGNGPDFEAEQALLDLLLSEPAPAEVQVQEENLLGSAAKGKLVAMWGEWNEGRFIPRGFVNSTSEQVEKIARKQAVANETELRRRELDRKNAKIVHLEALLKAKTAE